VNQAILIIIGGGLGSLLRYWMSMGAYVLFGRSFPYGTLSVNILGSFLMGFLSILLLERLNGQSDYLRALLLIGFLGGFTTFSSFSMETLSLLESGEMLKGLLNVISSVGLCILAVTLGALLGRQI
jgi:CrcB protein